METGIVRFLLYSVPLVGDLRKAYHSFLVDEDTARFCMLHWWKDPSVCSIPRIFTCARVYFGDNFASSMLELFHRLWMKDECKLDVTKYLLCEARYSDNLQFSFKGQQEMEQVKDDLKEGYSKFSINLKFLRSLSSIEKTKYENDVERLLGMKFDLHQDTISPDVHLNVYGKARGKPLGPDLVDTDPEIGEITRLTISRILPQTYDRSGFLLGPLILCLKIFYQGHVNLYHTSHTKTTDRVGL